MASLAEASLSEREREALSRAVERLEQELGEELHAVWLYGSRARGEYRGEESDVDLLVVARRDGWDELLRISNIVDEAAELAGAKPSFFSTHVYTPERIAQRREIRSFFIQEVDRDKIVLYGEP